MVRNPDAAFLNPHGPAAARIFPAPSMFCTDAKITTSSTTSLSVGSPEHPQARIASKPVSVTSGRSPVTMALNRAAAFVNTACWASLSRGAEKPDVDVIVRLDRRRHVERRVADRHVHHLGKRGATRSP